jgi:hypothetical protein
MLRSAGVAIHTSVHEERPVAVIEPRIHVHWGRATSVVVLGSTIDPSRIVDYDAAVLTVTGRTVDARRRPAVSRMPRDGSAVDVRRRPAITTIPRRRSVARLQLMIRAVRVLRVLAAVAGPPRSDRSTREQRDRR